MNTFKHLKTLYWDSIDNGLPEIINCELGTHSRITIHFFWNSKKSLRISEPTQASGISENDNWKLKIK